MHKGEEVLGIRLNWNKRYITLAPRATVLGLAFKLYDPEKLLGDKEEIGITCALIPTSHPGVRVGDRHYPMGLAFLNGPTFGKDVFIPLDWIIGGPDYAGRGWRMLVECLSAGRGISLPALGTACGHMASRTVGAYSYVRKQFGMSIGKFEGGAGSAGPHWRPHLSARRRSSHDRRFPGLGSGTGHRHRDFQVPHDRDGPPGDG